jgi:hypothetical protein
MIVIAVFFMKIGKLFGKKKQKEPEQDIEHLGREGGYAEGRRTEADAIADALAQTLPSGIEVKESVKLAEKKLVYLVKVQNNTGEMMGDVKLGIAPDDSIVQCREPRKTVKFIDPGKSHIFKFVLEPKMVSGTTKIQGLLRYFDFSDKEQHEHLIPDYNLNISSPDIQSKEVDEEFWRITMSRLKVYEVETAEMDFEPGKVFNHFSKVVEKMGFYALKPNVVPTLYRGIAKFYGQDAFDEPHCVEIQVVGFGNKTRLLLRVWAPSLQRAIGITFKFLGKVDKRLEIKENITSIQTKSK